MPFLCSFSFFPNSNNTDIDILHINFRCLFGPWINNAIHINTFTSLNTTGKSASHCITYFLSHILHPILFMVILRMNVDYFVVNRMCAVCSMHSMYLLPQPFSNSTIFHFIHFSHCIAAGAGIQHETHFMMWTLCCWCENYIWHSLCMWECVKVKRWTSRRILKITK